MSPELESALESYKNAIAASNEAYAKCNMLQWKSDMIIAAELPEAKKERHRAEVARQEAEYVLHKALFPDLK